MRVIMCLPYKDVGHFFEKHKPVRVAEGIRYCGLELVAYARSTLPEFFKKWVEKWREPI